ncbi:MAG: toll/interleukin-1 receptor domain-containing protein, partial [Acidobacteriota bacterium]
MTEPVESFDVFLSHASHDRAWVEALAENLVRLGLKPYFDRWQISLGDVLMHELDHGLRTSRAGVLVVSPEALARPLVQAEYAAMLTAAVNHGRPLIPVIYRDAEMPPMLQNFLWIDFRGLDGEPYFARVRKLAEALRGQRKGPPANLGSELQPPPGSGVRAAGPIRRLLRFEPGATTLLG